MAEQSGGRKHRRAGGVRGTAAAAVAMVTLTASQAPVPAAPAADSGERTVRPGPPISDRPYRTELPPLPVPSGEGGSPGGSPSPAVAGRHGAVPATVLDAYRRAERTLARERPGCNLSWQLLAAIGQVESGQARGGRVTADGTAEPAILGPRLDGGGFALIRDTDGGAHDGDTVFDRAVGPLQFIPSTWAVWGSDGNGDGRADPNNVYDAALAAGRYLCADGRDLSDPYDLDRAVLGYNPSRAYLRTVRAWFAYFRSGHTEVPDTAVSRPSPSASPSPSRTAGKGLARGRGDGGRTSTPAAPQPSAPRRDPGAPSPEPTRERPRGPGAAERVGDIVSDVSDLTGVADGSDGSGGSGGPEPDDGAASERVPPLPAP